MSLPTPSVQLYTLVEEFRADPARSLDKLAALGLRHVEAFDFVSRPTEIRAALDASGLTAATGHAPLLSDELWTPDGTIPTPEPEAVLEAAATLGLTTVIDPFVEPERWATVDGVAEIGERLNAVADLAATYGLGVGYHNHAQEFLLDIDGVSAFEYVVAHTDERVAIELDLFWALTGGQDVPALVRRLGSRLLAVHVKDGFVPTENPFAPGADRDVTRHLDQRRPGEGQVPVVEAMRATDAVRWAVIEYDRSPGDVFDDIAASYAFLLEKGLAA
ncbi:sugar phosphate isomerase/epimerase family protein [Microbacterium trichothecenolyticum]|uniref:Sugar phosphate isomerase/epimerase n=1 Tax=Microbacterium trichothecenolyticum TaxID=69370 RepID=A0ABU0TXF7_MICTR|nr:sugar phosphate isomerase/epimerase [Microbacterium trichothecenolyticum]MDQ1124343.1 sugar phosphate isomerase/epimerase [Microbacterium trichothecenolyticum]